MEHRLLAKGILVNMLGILARVSRAVFLIVFSRLLGSELFGLYLLAFAIQEIVSKVAIAGLNFGIMRVVGVLKGENREDEIRPTVMKILLLTFVISSAVALALAIGAEWVAVAFGSKIELATPLRIFCLGMPACCLTFILLYAIRPTLDMRYEVYVQSVIEPLVILVLGTLALTMGFGVKGAVFAHVAAYFLNVVIALYYFKKLFPKTSTSKEVKLNWPQLWHTAIPMGGVEFLTMFKNRLDLMVIGRFLPLNAVGIYGAVVEIVTVLRKTRAAFDPILMPILQNFHIQGDRKRLHDSFALAVRWVMIPSLALLGPFFLIPEAFLDFFGADFVQGSRSLTIYAVGQFFVVSFGLMESALSITGFAYVTLVNSVVLLLGNFVLLLWFVPKFGMNGAAAATSISLIVITVWRLIQGHRRLEIFPFDRTQIKPMIAFLIGLVVGGVVKTLLPNQDFPILVTTGIVFVCTYLTALFLMGLEAGDKDVLNRIGIRLKWLRR